MYHTCLSVQKVRINTEVSLWKKHAYTFGMLIDISTMYNVGYIVYFRSAANTNMNMLLVRSKGQGYFNGDNFKQNKCKQDLLQTPEFIILKR